MKQLRNLNFKHRSFYWIVLRHIVVKWSGIQMTKRMTQLCAYIVWLLLKPGDFSNVVCISRRRSGVRLPVP